MDPLFVEILAVLGFFLSIYALYVKHRKKKNPLYKPLCDIRENISCTKAFASEYSELTALPNMISGIVFYALVFAAAWFKLTLVVTALSFLAVLLSCYLGYVSYYQQKNYCVVCSAVYFVNVLILVSSLL